MIEELRIKNFAIIDSLSIQLKEGFNVITGETGAGKSIIVDAIGVLLKEKISAADFVKHGKNEAIVEVVLGDVRISESDEDFVILKRVIPVNGKTKSYVNDSIYTSQGFVKVASQFINIHGQHEHTYLLRRENHIDFFDTITGLTEEVKNFTEIYEKVVKLREKVESLKNELIAKKQRKELIEFQLREIESAQLREGEEEELNEQRRILKNVLKLKELAEDAFSLLYDGKNSVHENLSKTLMVIKELLRFDSKAEEIKNLIESSLAQIDESIYSLRKLKDTYEPDPFTLEKIEERLTLINRLKSKYGSSVGEIIEYGKNIEKELSSISISEDEMKKLQEELVSLEAEMDKKAEEISMKRKKLAAKVETLVNEELKEVGFSNPRFEVKIREREIWPKGKDDLEFYFSANPGEPPKPLSKVASGGELSRLMLALKCVELKEAKKDIKSMTLIFDEIDSGVGGTVAENVGKRLRELARHHQVICVTHLPQIAAKAQHHLKVEKIIWDEKTTVKVELLNKAKRKEEIARMLSGRITESSLFHAEELLQG
ncbi:DNA repair protein RecN [Thermodesulfovibrio aggregans]|uniref:DNA repair protein RecN n=1 Tax=Thermodesulfovibrio aggregans TaxID=86166 RepID=A0A0U9HM08_9BACT|nr:DNA repair protein RecN [Thermodesulfovibrio aggregans]GAQ94151.1 DNA repair protein RecN [Thermodesulfovibrio aggregans]